MRRGVGDRGDLGPRSGMRHSRRVRDTVGRGSRALEAAVPLRLKGQVGGSSQIRRKVVNHLRKPGSVLRVTGGLDVLHGG